MPEHPLKTPDCPALPCAALSARSPTPALQLASFQGGVDGKTSASAEATPLPPEQMRPAGPITLAGVRHSYLWLADCLGRPFLISLRHPGLRMRCLAARGEITTARTIAERGGGRAGLPALHARGPCVLGTAASCTCTRAGTYNPRPATATALHTHARTRSLSLSHTHTLAHTCPAPPRALQAWLPGSTTRPPASWRP